MNAAFASQRRRRWTRSLFVLASIAGPAAQVSRADIAPSQVLVVYNAANADSTAVANAYLAAHPDIPAQNVVALNNVAISQPQITYAQFTSLIRDPIRAHLLAAGPPDPSGIIAIVLMRPFAHRILDTDNPNIGDNPNGAFLEFLPPSAIAGGQADSTNCSVDAELVLLWQPLDTGEAGGIMDSLSDNLIDNPFHTSISDVHLFSRANIQTAKVFTNTLDVVWQLGGTGATRLMSGDIYLVTRIDAQNTADAIALIDRSQDILVNKARVNIILDEWNLAGPPAACTNDLDDDPLFSSGDPFNAGDDYEDIRTFLQNNGWIVEYDATTDFITGDELPDPIVAYASYGENHKNGGCGEDPPGAGTYLQTFNFAPGAMFNTLESYNGRALNTLGTLFDQEQVADFISTGGTFGIGHVWEPFTFSVPDNEFLFANMLVRGMTWAEAAYSAIPVLSWHHVVVGDPLATLTILNDPGLPPGDLNDDDSANGLDIDWFVDILINGIDGYRAAFPALDPFARADFTGDFVIDHDDVPGFVAVLVGE